MLDRPTTEAHRTEDVSHMMVSHERVQQNPEEESGLCTHPSMEQKRLRGDYVDMSNEMIEVIATDDLLAEAVEEVGDLAEGRQYVYQYDNMVHTQHDQNFIFQLYQPLETENGTFLCRICMELGDTIEFETKGDYAHHRYKVHGSYNNNHICPVLHCREIYASMTVLRKHLVIDHKLPIEMHFRTFANIGEFERFRHLVEILCNCRFMMHTKQPHNKRQIMHCSKSEHKIILQSRRHKLPHVRMMKEGAQCPAHISFRIDPKTGHVDAFYQLFHYGHAREYRDTNEDGLPYECDPMPNRPIDVVFPESPDHPADRPLQYVQIDLLNADSCVYVNTIYSHILIITDIKTGFIFAKPIPEAGPRQLLIRLLTDIFLQFGVPEGFSCSHSVTLIRDVISAINCIFRVNMKEILYDTPDYNVFLETLYDQATFELQSKHRWVEMVQFTTMILNQSGKKSPFERMFNRKPYNLPGQKIPPWLQGEDLSVDSEDEHIDVELDEQDEEQTESEDRFATAPPRYNAGDKVYLRNLDTTPGRGNVLPYLYGYIGATDWENSPHFPYRVHFSKSKDPWPSESSVSAWVSPYDVLPTTHDLLVIPDEERQRVASALLCSCEGGEYGSPCPLFRSYLCGNGMAKACCLNTQKPCEYHLECTDGDDTYYRMESITKLYTEGQPRMKQTRRKIPSLAPESVPTHATRDDAVEMPVLTSESIPVVTTIVIENEDRTFVPALSKRVDNGLSSAKGMVTSLSRDRLKNLDRSGITSNEKPPLAKRPRRAIETETLEQKQHQISSDSQQEDALKSRTRKSTRASKTKVFEDFVAIP
ncbi:Zinc finger C2H2 type [Trichostrongylus colubriformis]|uniref:Zinc finger C2H2 type n=1 Tax=Trichostrongylus colubriformis TaxID=6319 RepID=A0AAN8EXM1_TRICO